MTKEQLLAAIKKSAKKLGRAPTRVELRRKLNISDYWVWKHFKNLGNALAEAGLEPRGGGHKASLRKLLEDWGRLARKLGRPPSVREYMRAGKYNPNTLKLRCGGYWSKIGAQFRAMAKAEKIEREWTDVLAMVGRWEGSTGREVRLRMARLGQAEPAPSTLVQPRIKLDREIYGPPCNLPGLRYEPTCENGVMFAFGQVAHKLGFAVERVQTAFPDCVAMREVAPGKWQRENVELELYSKNFVEHGHDPKRCDTLVCWVHDWAECPGHIEVIELSKIVRNLGIG
jgi:hypothetical protein